ncbi:MAG: hypothetical protein SFW67_29810 [Myxococcaceae bacterium]|nr:hypothetical protein [Myxococcaceae bacterium]
MSATCAIHTDTPATGVCPRCGNFICGRCELDAAKNCPSCVKLVGASLAVELPWEQREQLGLVKAFWEQTKLGITKPGQYVASIRPDRPWQEAFVYGWIVSILAGVLSIPYNGFNFWSQGAQMKETFGKLGSSGPLQMMADFYTWLGDHPFLAAAGLAGYTIAIYPLTMLLNGAMQQVGLMLAGVNPRQPIAATLRAGSYAVAPNLLTAIPVVGGFAAFYTLVVQIWALREVHHTTTLKAVVAALWFSVVVGCCAAFAGVAFAFQAISKLR